MRGERRPISVKSELLSLIWFRLFAMALVMEMVTTAGLFPLWFQCLRRNSNARRGFVLLASCGMVFLGAFVWCAYPCPHSPPPALSPLWLGLIAVLSGCPMSCSVLFCPVSSWPVLSCSVLCYPALFCPVMSSLLLSCPVLSWPVRQCLVLYRRFLSIACPLTSCRRGGAACAC